MDLGNEKREEFHAKQLGTYATDFNHFTDTFLSAIQDHVDANELNKTDLCLF